MTITSFNPIETAKEIATKTLKTAGATALISLGSDAAKGQEAKKDTFDGRTKNVEEISKSETQKSPQEIINASAAKARISDGDFKNGAKFVSTTEPKEGTPEFIKQQILKRENILKEYSTLIPANKKERESFDERIKKLNNSSLKTLLKASDYLVKKDIISPDMQQKFLKSDNLLLSAHILGKAANVKKDQLATDQRIKDFINQQFSSLTLLAFNE